MSEEVDKNLSNVAGNTSGAYEYGDVRGELPHRAGYENVRGHENYLILSRLLEGGAKLEGGSLVLTRDQIMDYELHRKLNAPPQTEPTLEPWELTQFDTSVENVSGEEVPEPVIGSLGEIASEAVAEVEETPELDASAPSAESEELDSSIREAAAGHAQYNEAAGPNAVEKNAELDTISIEELKELANKSYFSIHTHIQTGNFSHGQIPIRHVPEEVFLNQGGKLEPAHVNLLVALDNISADGRRNKLESQELEKMRTPEMIGMIPAEEYLQGKVNVHPDTYFVLEYKTIRQSGNYVFKDGVGRPGDHLSGALVINGKETAEKLWKAIESNPGVARQAVIAMMGASNLSKGSSSLHRNDMKDPLIMSKEQQKQELPPWSDWKEENGGVNRMALRKSLNASPSKCIVKEF
jgi:hypothetical protein